MIIISSNYFSLPLRLFILCELVIFCVSLHFHTMIQLKLVLLYPYLISILTFLPQFAFHTSLKPQWGPWKSSRDLHRPLGPTPVQLSQRAPIPRIPHKLGTSSPRHRNPPDQAQELCGVCPRKKRFDHKTFLVKICF